MIQPYIEAGANHIMALDYGAIIGGGDPHAATRRMTELYSHLRRLNGHQSCQETLYVPYSNHTSYA